MKKICLLDPSLMDQHGSPSINLGDIIIHRAVLREIKEIFSEFELVRLSTHSALESEHLRLIQQSAFILVGGTNLLSSRMREYQQWKVSFEQALTLRRAVLFGVGWWQYQTPPDTHTTLFLTRALHGNLWHSVRDSYTQQQLASINIKNTLNTHCPTMWPLVNMNLSALPTQKANQVLLMLTDYYQHPELDKQLIELLLSNYEKVFFWPQGSQDLDYVSRLNYPIHLLDHSIESLDSFLSLEQDFDYIGTRLHGGITCMLAGRRSLIIEVDNRAREISIDTGLPTVRREDLDYIRTWIEGSSPPQISLNIDNINRWKNQFKTSEIRYGQVDKALRLLKYSTRYWLEEKGIKL